MLIHGARVVLFRSNGLNIWVNRIKEKRGFNRAVVALANKRLRVASVIIARREKYSPVMWRKINSNYYVCETYPEIAKNA